MLFKLARMLWWALRCGFCWLFLDHSFGEWQLGARPDLPPHLAGYYPVFAVCRRCPRKHHRFKYIAQFPIDMTQNFMPYWWE